MIDHISIWSNIIDVVNLYPFLCHNLDSEQRGSLVHTLSTEKFKFNWINPSGHWRLDMANRVHREVMMQLCALNEVESLNSEQLSKRNDTSQKVNDILFNYMLIYIFIFIGKLV